LYRRKVDETFTFFSKEKNGKKIKTSVKKSKKFPEREKKSLNDKNEKADAE
jgi:hypothetical protein